MKRTLSWMIIGGLAVVGVLFANDDQIGNHQARHTETIRFHLNGIAHTATIDEDEVIASPSWTAAAALPLKPAEAEEIARKEISKLGTDEREWEVWDFNLVRLMDSSPPKWYYSVSFDPVLKSTNQGSISVLVAFSGRPGKFDERQGNNVKR